MSRVVSALLCTALAVPAQSAPDSIARVGDLGQLPRLEAGVTSGLFSSADPSGSTRSHYLRTSGSRHVLAEMAGPGVVVRLAATNPDGVLHVTLDGEPVPRLVCPFAELFGGKVAPFVAPLVSRAGGAGVSCLPIPYARSCRIEVDELARPETLRYEVQYLTYSKGTALRTFTRELPEGEARALAALTSRFAERGPSAFERSIGTGAPGVSPGGTRDFVVVQGAGRVVELDAHVICHQMYERHVLLEVYYDGSAEPSIRVPLLDAFAMGFMANFEAGDWMLGRKAGRCWLRLPMPFRKGIRIALRNLGGDHVSVDLRAVVENGPVDAREGYLHAEFRAQDRVQGGPFVAADLHGHGKLVGITQALQGIADSWHLEGRPAIRIDDGPALLGTGTLEFFNGTAASAEARFAAPFWGLNVQDEDATWRTMPWRFLLPDAIPFEQSLTVSFEHGRANRVQDAYYSAVAWWYAEKPSAVRAVGPADVATPRIWVTPPRGWTPAAELEWRGEVPVERALAEEFAQFHRSLTMPVRQEYPASWLEDGGEPLDGRVVVFRGARTTRSWQANLPAPATGSYFLDVLAFQTTAENRPSLRIGKRAPYRLDAEAGAYGLRRYSFGPLDLAAGANAIEFTQFGPFFSALVALRLRSATPIQSK